MLIKELANQSWYGSIGYIKNDEDILTIQSYLQYNYPVLKEFKGHIFTFTYKELKYESLKTAICSLFPNAEIIILDKNRGHNHGYADLDNAVFDYCKKNNIEWLCKSAMDMVISSEVLEIEIPQSDFYYLNGIGYGGMEYYNFDYDRIIEEDFYPQTNFYFINVSKTDYLNDSEYLDKTFEQISNIPNYNGRIWEYIKGWSCEDFLSNTVKRNNLSKYHLVSEENYRTLLNVVKNNRIIDSSHKNIMIEGICHHAHPQDPILKI